MTYAATAPQEYAKLLKLWAEIDDLNCIGSVLHWDEQTQMPTSGSAARADHMATIARLTHARISSSELGNTIEKLLPWAEGLPAESDEGAIVKVAKREYDKATKISADLVDRMSDVRSRAFLTWLKSREEKDFAVFRPALEEVYEVSRAVAESLGYKEHPLDPLVDQQEPGMTVNDVDVLFAELREALVPLAKAIAETGETGRDAM